jgi:hypothetical protein
MIAGQRRVQITIQIQNKQHLGRKIVINERERSQSLGHSQPAEPQQWQQATSK